MQIANLVLIIIKHWVIHFSLEVTLTQLIILLTMQFIFN